MLSEILLGLLLLTNIIELLIITSFTYEEDVPELSDEMRRKIYA